ncbi:conjugal transfer protein TraF [Pseudoduganella sp. UC29_106]|uniref:conjugal transfer protein TraF n=1 Tax=Pseudoduganella sp. UC29_106 TaxID=3374553 RepID=UPI00375737BE
MKSLTNIAVSFLLVASPAFAQQIDNEKAGLASPSSVLAASRRGWHFYDDPLLERESKPQRPARAIAPEKTELAARPELERFRQLQREVEEVRAIAIIRPTEANVRRYMELESRVVGNASRFADLAQRIAWASPELDPATQGRPVNASALEAYEQQQGRLRAGTLAALARDHVLIFFFRGDCGYCHKMAPVLTTFRQRHGIPMVAVSVDGGSIAEISGARVDNGIVRALKVSQVPAVFLAQPFTGRIVPVGYGVLSEAQLVERIMALADQSRSPVSEASAFWPN